MATRDGHTPPSMETLATAAARTLTTTTKTIPQTQATTPRWLLRILPWEEVSGGTYRVNRRLTFTIGDGRVTFVQTGSQVQVVPQELREIALLRDFEDDDVLAALAGRFVQREVEPGEAIVQAGQPAEEICLIAHGKVKKVGFGEYGEPTLLGMLADGDHFAYQAIVESGDRWPFSAVATTRCTVLVMTQQAFEEVAARSPSLQAHVAAFRAGPGRPQDRHGQAAIDLAAGHAQEDALPGTYVDYDASPREYGLDVAQTELRVHTRVSDLFNDPIDQTEQQLRLTIEALRERQEHELVNNPEFGLLHNADFRQRIWTRGGPPTPEDMDELVSRRRKTRYFLAHPRAIAAFGRECNRRGIYPQDVESHGTVRTAWRGVPIFPCDKIPISETQTTSIIAMRIGAADQGVVGLHQTGIPDEIEPGLSARLTGIDEKGIASYLVSAYYSVAVLIPDALGVLENVELGR